jgi:hypothetical protein
MSDIGDKTATTGDGLPASPRDAAQTIVELYGDDAVRWAQVRLEAARALGAFGEIWRWEQILDRIRELSIARRIERRRTRGR